MTSIAKRLNRLGWTLRSGCAIGADTAFENGAGELKELYVAKAGVAGGLTPTQECFTLAASLHPAWHTLTPYVKALMARNMQQILGYELKTPAAMVVCWTPDGCESSSDRTRETGGTGQAISCASNNGIPIYNLKNPESVDRLEEYLSNLEYDFHINSLLPIRLKSVTF
jgi:hypothetical protein